MTRPFVRLLQTVRLERSIWDLAPGDAEAIMRRHALRPSREEVQRCRQQCADLIYAALTP